MNTRAIDLQSSIQAPADHLVPLIGTLLGFTSAMHTEADLIKCLEQGLAIEAVQSLRTRAGLTDAEVFKLIGPRLALDPREETGQALSREEAAKTVRIALMLSRVQQTLGSEPGYAIEWLRQPQSALANRTPMQALTTESGVLAVEEILVRVEHGMFA